jgi:hypothetical protein
LLGYLILIKKQMPKSCFFRFLIWMALALIAVIALFLYSTLPNDIEWVEKPIDLSQSLQDLTFPNRPMSELILKQPAENILYQAVFQEEIADFTINYKAVFKMKRPIELDNPLPLKKVLGNFKTL